MSSLFEVYGNSKGSRSEDTRRRRVEWKVLISVYSEELYKYGQGEGVRSKSPGKRLTGDWYKIFLQDNTLGKTTSTCNEFCRKKLY